MITEQDGSRSSRRRWAAGVLATVVLVAAAVVGVVVALPSGGSTAPEQSAMPWVAPGGPIELADLSAEHRAHYEAAAADPDAFSRVTCYCGCEEFLGHRNLHECFVRPEGGWERHATGCSVCLAEAGEVAEMREQGVPVGDVIEHIDERFGAITAPTT